MPRFALLLAVVAALMGAIGVALAALATHTQGGDIGRTAAEFLILHAAALMGVTAHARAVPRVRFALCAGAVLAVGTVLFSGDLTMRAYAQTRMFPSAAPIGGTMMILAWLGLAIAFAWATIPDGSAGKSVR